MTAEHAAKATPKARELVDDVLIEFDRWADSCADQAASVGRDKREAARHALIGMRAELLDELGARFGVTLASWGEGA